MVYSGADLVRNSGLQAERAEKLRSTQPSVQPVSKLEHTGSSLDEQTQSALFRFARFINKESKPRPKPKMPPKRASNLPEGYTRQLAIDHHGTGSVLNIYV